MEHAVQSGTGVASLPRTSRTAEPAVVLAAAAVILTAGRITDGCGPPSAGSAVSPDARRPAPPPVSIVQLRLVAPRTAVPGERITVLASRNRTLCGPVELRFDDAPISHRPAWYAGPLNPAWTLTAVTVHVPDDVRPGRHEIALYGPVPGGRTHPVCADRPEHQARLDTATIAVAQ